MKKELKEARDLIAEFRLQIGRLVSRSGYGFRSHIKAWPYTNYRR